jgi:hypothetical protein
VKSEKEKTSVKMFLKQLDKGARGILGLRGICSFHSNYFPENGKIKKKKNLFERL